MKDGVNTLSESTNQRFLCNYSDFRTFYFLTTFHGSDVPVLWRISLFWCSSDRCASNACVLVTMTLADNQTAEGALRTAGQLRTWCYQHTHWASVTSTHTNMWTRIAVGWVDKYLHKNHRELKQTIKESRLLLLSHFSEMPFRMHLSLHE